MILLCARRVMDPLDVAGKRPNFLTGEPYTADRAEWARVWSRFPLYANKAKLLELTSSLAANAVTIVVSATGSGKTVVTPALVARHAAETLGLGVPWRVALTTPKRVTTQLAAKTGARTLGVELGREVGYQFRGAPKGSSGPATRVLYSTDGSLLVGARRDPTFREYAAIIVDEAHERPVPTDMLLLAVRGALVARPEMRLVVMSATIDPEEFRRFYAAVGLGVGVVEVGGATMHPIERVFLPRPLADGDAYVEEGLRIAEEIVAERKGTAADRDILFFVPTTRDASGGCRAFSSACRKRECAAVSCASLYSKLSEEGRGSALLPVAPPFDRKLVFATNIAESSITLDGLRHVIDSGLEVSSVWDPLAHGTVLSKRFTTRSQIMQRVGRVGRTSPGVAHHLYTQAFFDALPQYPAPAITTIDFTGYVMERLAAGESLAATVAYFRTLLTPPTDAQLASAASFLHFHGMVAVVDRSPSSRRTPRPVAFAAEAYAAPGAVDRLDGAVTEHGRLVQGVADHMRMSLPNALLVCAGIVYGCSPDVCTLASLLEAVGGEVSTLWRDAGESASASAAEPRERYRGSADAGSDHRSLVRVFREVFTPLRRAAGAGPEGERALREATAKAGLSFDVWRNVDDRVKRDGWGVKRLVERWASRGPAADAALPPLFRLPPVDAAGGDVRFERALMAARAYHFARAVPVVPPNARAQAGGNGGKPAQAPPTPRARAAAPPAMTLETVSPPSRVRALADPVFASFPGKGAAVPGGGYVGALYESLVESGGRRAMSVVTWV